MKRTKINLLLHKENYTQIEKYFSWIRILTIGYSIILVLIVALLLFFIFRQNQEIQSLLNRKSVFLAELGGRREDEAKLIYIAKKMDSYGTFIRDDARFIPYYNLLIDALKTSTESAALSSFVIDKKRDVDFILSFGNLDDMLASFRFIESRAFLKNFEELQLTQFSSQSDKVKKYELSFEGKFINLDEKNN